ncbi:MAG: AAA family ATPase [Candidatus Aminicenantes bacterium]|nr:AAA family ATPase [Candidatus Aminicenantes bacterium]
MFKKIKIEQFRGISNLELNDLRQFNLFVGKNNCGKTSLLESIILISTPSNPFYPVMINNMRGHYITQPYSWTVLFNKLDIESPIRLTGEILKPKEIRTLTINILPDKNVAQPTYEHFGLSQSRTEFDKIIGLSIEFSISKHPRKINMYESKIWLGRENKLESSPPENYIETLKSIFLTPVTLRPNIPRWFNQVLIKKQDEKILKILQTVEPRLVNLFLGSENIVYGDMGFTKLLPLNTAGEGLNNLLAIILAIYETSGGVVLIDEIENGLHYSTQAILWAAVIEAATAFNVQVFASTHSYETVKAFSAACEKLDDKDDKVRLFRLENEKDKIRLIDFNHEMLSTAIMKDWEVR